MLLQTAPGVSVCFILKALFTEVVFFLYIIIVFLRSSQNNNHFTKEYTCICIPVFLRPLQATLQANNLN